MVLEGWVVGGSGWCHLHGRDLGRLGVQMRWPLEEDKTHEAWQAHDSRPHTLWSRFSGRGRWQRPPNWEVPVGPASRMMDTCYPAAVLPKGATAPGREGSLRG